MICSAEKLVNRINFIKERFDLCDTIQKVGKVIEVTGLIIKSEGPEVALGDLVVITSERKKTLRAYAVVAGFQDNLILLTPLETVQDIHPGCKTVVDNSGEREIPVGNGLKGRILNALGKPIDNLGPLYTNSTKGLYRDCPCPMERTPITDALSTGIKAIDGFIPLGIGQRMGIFAGSGVGKSTLLGMIARGSSADVNVIALVGERGRELREFIDKELGYEGMKKTVVVVSTSDQAPPMRVRAALLATRIAEEFREQGKNVLFLMDSVTRFAMAQREIGLAAGEPPTSRGYTPSVFSMLPQLMERTGTNAKGSITALYTVLVEGDDMNEPIADSVRGILDGHIILDRALATSNHFPAINVLDSVSRLTNTLLNKQQFESVSRAKDWLATYKKNEDLINIGAYASNTNPKIDLAIEKNEQIQEFLKQDSNRLLNREESLDIIQKLVQ